MTSAERTTKLSAIGRQIARLLSGTEYAHGTWSFIEPTENTYSVQLRNAGKGRIYLQFDGYNEPTRLSISGGLHIGKNGQYVEVYDRGADGTGWNRVTAPSITVALSRDPIAIARDIARRFIPEYLRVLALAEAKIAADNAYESTIAANLQRLAKATGQHVNVEDPNDLRGEVRKSFTWKLRNNYHTVTASEERLLTHLG